MAQQFRLKRTAWFSSFRVFEGIALLVGVLAVAGCRLDNNTTGTTGPQGLIQFINAAPRYGSVSLNIDSTKVVMNQLYGTGSSVFVTALATARQLTVRDSANTTVLVTNTLVVADQTVYTVILTQHSVGGGLLILRDTVSAPPPNQVGLRHNMMTSLTLLLHLQLDSRDLRAASATWEEVLGITKTVEKNASYRSKAADVAAAYAAAGRLHAEERSAEAPRWYRASLAIWDELEKSGVSGEYIGPKRRQTQAEMKQAMAKRR